MSLDLRLLLIADHYRQAIVTGRGGVGNVRAAPAKLDATSISHPQTASILAEHEAHTLEYEREVWKRHKEEKANKPVSLTQI